MTLRKRNGVYQIDLTGIAQSTGHEFRVRQSTGTRDRKLAQLKHAEMEMAIHKGEYTPSRKGKFSAKRAPSVADVFDDAFHGIWMADSSESTRRTALALYRGLTSGGYIDPAQPFELFATTASIESLVVALKGTGRANSSINSVLWVIRAMVNRASLEGIISLVPDIPSPLKKSAGRIRYFTQEEEREILEWLSVREEWDVCDWLIVSLDTGGRISEVLRTTPDRVTQAGIVFDETKNRGTRVVPLTSRARASLQERVKANPDGLLWPYGDFHPTRYWKGRIARLLGAACKDLELPYATPHTTRHTYATRLLAGGVDVRTAMYLLGHSTVAQTMKYAHLVDERIEASVTVIEAQSLSHQSAQAPKQGLPEGPAQGDRIGSA